MQVNNGLQECMVRMAVRNNCVSVSLKGTPVELEESQGHSLTDILARELYLGFSNWNLTHMRALGIWTPGFYTEFRAGSI